VPIGRWLGALLAERREVLNGTPYVFPGPGKTGHFHEPRAALRRVAIASGIPEVTPHDLRRTFGSIAADCVPYPVVKALVGHSAGRDVTLVHYSQPSPGELARHMQTVENKILSMAGVEHGPTA
jgi:integrase